MYKVLGNIYHPIIHKIRNSQFLHVIAINKMLKKSIKNENRKNRLYVDITNLHTKDNGTGIDRVTKEISSRFVNFTKKYNVVCIYNKNFNGYYDVTSDSFITFSKGDIYFSLDDGTSYSAKYDRLFNKLISEDISVFFFIHDLIPIRFPELSYSKNALKKYDSFLRRIITYSGVICNSYSTYKDFCSWISENTGLKKNNQLRIGYSLLGCDFSARKKFNAPSPPGEKYNNTIKFLMVATVEPKKKYDQVIKAFDIIWKKGYNIQLTIVGRKGWKSEKTFSLIEQNNEYGKRLVWYNTGISDEELFTLYEESTSIIMASITEGFGLSVAEAAHFEKPLIVRDIPPFREIAGDNAFYFTGLEPEDLASAIEKWIELFHTARQPNSSKIKLRTWDDCAKEIYTFITGEQP